MNTLDGMTVEQLRELATRAQRTADAQEKAQKDEKDIIPGDDGSVWEYGGRYWTVAKGDVENERLLHSIPVEGGVVRGWWCTTRFSTSLVPEGGGWPVGTEAGQRCEAYIKAVARLALRVRP